MTTPPSQGQNPYAQPPTAPLGQQPGQPGVPPQQFGQAGIPPQQFGQPGVPPQGFGQPGVPPQGGAPYAPFPNQGGPAPAPVPPQKKSKKALRVIGSILVVAIVLVVKFGIGFGLRWWADETDAETTSVGSCMHNDGTESNADLKEVDCSSSQAQYKVVEKFDDTSDDSKCQNVPDATISYYQLEATHKVVLCLKENK
ncbi:hypothetical protein AB0C59_26690 [Streptomyces sp. NPDC048664]|uniref:LppU/SCO3897 family protein n=1 Tax=Streptomyces sp. NPDC048664 TaxID=3154505 RepID=UPI00342776E7